MRRIRCADCGVKFPRRDIVPPVGALRPPGCPWRCLVCHGKRLRQLAHLDEFHKTQFMAGLKFDSETREIPAKPPGTVDITHTYRVTGPPGGPVVVRVPPKNTEGFR